MSRRDIGGRYDRIGLEIVNGGKGGLNIRRGELNVGRNVHSGRLVIVTAEKRTRGCSAQRRRRRNRGMRVSVYELTLHVGSVEGRHLFCGGIGVEIVEQGVNEGAGLWKGRTADVLCCRVSRLLGPGPGGEETGDENEEVDTHSMVVVVVVVELCRCLTRPS